MENPTRYSDALAVVVHSSSAAMVFDENKLSFQNQNDEDDDSCCICFEPFTPHDPANITSCKHEYHLQCILEWSQRSKECPICLQDFVLKDPISQELLAAVETNRHFTSRGVSSAVYRDHPHQHLNEELEDTFDSEESGFSDNRRRFFLESRDNTNLRDSDLSSGHGHSQGSVFPDSDLGVYLRYAIPSSDDGLSDGDSEVSSMISPLSFQGPLSISQPPLNEVSTTSASEEGPFKRRLFFTQSASVTPQRPSSSNAASFSESLKSKLTAASARYKESISKGTRGIKEKLLARNNSVKELSKGVQREMSAGIAGVARMIERLDLKSKQSGPAVSVSGFTGGASSVPSKGKAVQENVVWPADNCTRELPHDLKSSTTPSITNNASSHVDVSYAQKGQ